MNGLQVLNRKRTSGLVAEIDGTPVVYVGRPTKWGNPFKVGVDGTRAAVIGKYESYLRNTPKLLAALPELRGKHLECWCAPQSCHADVLLRLANQDKKA